MTDEEQRYSVALSFCKIVMLLKKYPSLAKKFKRRARWFKDVNIRCFYDVYYQEKGILPIFLKTIFSGTRFYFREREYNSYWEWESGIETFVIKSRGIQEYYEGSDFIRRTFPAENPYLIALETIERGIDKCIADIVDSNEHISVQQRTDKSGLVNRFFFYAPGFDETTFQFLSHFFLIYDLVQDGLLIIKQAKQSIKEEDSNEDTKCVA